MYPKKLIFLALLLVLCGVKAHAESMCLTGYTVWKHTLHFDYDTTTNELSVITDTDKPIATTSVIETEDGYCPSGYTQYTRGDDYLYPVVETPVTCGAGQYPANGTCTSYTVGDCPSGRYNSAVVNTSMIASEDGYCPSGYTSYTRRDDYIYPLVIGTTLCGAGQYPANGVCTNYAQSSCPNDYVSYALNDNTFAQQTDGACATNYTQYANMPNCDISTDGVCANIPTVINITWNDGENQIATNTCTYNGTITLPETPTRPGYVFTGWVVTSE